MMEKLQGIVLGTVRHSDHHDVVNIYTPTHGRVSLLAAVPKGRRGAAYRAMLMPLGCVEFSCRMNAGKELQRPSGMTTLLPWRTIYFSPYKSATAMFLAEFLGRLLRDTQPEPHIYRYIAGSLEVFDSLPGAAPNFHLTFLSAFTHFMGIAPDLSGAGGIFDMRAGHYTPWHPGHRDILLPPASAVPRTLERLTYYNMHRLRLSRADRRTLLQGLLHYWGLHFPGVASLKSPDVLNALFN